MKLKERIRNILISTYLSKWQLKLFFAFIALGIVVAVNLFTQNLVDEIISREQNKLKIYASIYEHFDIDTRTEDLLFLIENITPTITFPFIMTDENDIPSEPYELTTLNVELDQNMSYEERRQYMIDYVQKIGNQYEPIIFYRKGAEGKVLNKFYYTHSNLVDKLRYFPLVAIMTITMFIIIGYIAFSNIRRNEQSRVWVGMSKEAAHQLGTPLSSLLAWLEILRHSRDNPDEFRETLAEMEKDINRLNTIATRFSKIGSKPERTNENMSELLDKVCNYFDKRLPHLGRKVEIERLYEGKEYEAMVNTDLFTWVLENLFKNAADAIEQKKGTISIDYQLIHDKRLVFIVKDSGKGMSTQIKRMIFNPGFTTKKRGWGLGLSLCKRIIEEYHNGKIFVKESAPGRGTIFQIEIPKS